MLTILSGLMGITLLFIGVLSARMLWRIERNEFLAAESNRCLNHFCEANNVWNSNGRVFRRGLAVVYKNGKKQFIKQAKLCDIGILE